MRRFQFSLVRMLSCVALLAVGMWLLRLAFESVEDRVAATVAFPVVLASAFGRLFGQAGVCAVSVVVLYCVLAILACLWLGICAVFIQALG